MKMAKNVSNVLVRSLRGGVSVILMGSMLIAAGCVRPEASQTGEVERVEYRGVDGPEVLHRAGFELREVSVNGRTIPYVLYTPYEIVRGQKPEKLPLVVFLHGSGESGTNGFKVMAHGPQRDLLWSRERWPAYIVMPQKPEERLLWDKYDDLVLAAVDEVMNERAIDKDRVYLTGLSQGGYGTWALGAKYADRWAALAPVCGWISDDTIPAKVKGLPIWAFHGGADDVVKPEGTSETVKKVNAAGGSAKATIYPGVNHNSWEKAYGDGEMAKWMFQQRRAGK